MTRAVARSPLFGAPFRIPQPPALALPREAPPGDVLPFPAPRAGQGAPEAPGAPVTFADFEAEILGPGGGIAAESMRKWLGRAKRQPAFRDIQAFVRKHDHKTLFSLTLDEVERLTADPDPRVRTAHALEGVSKSDGIADVTNFPTPWAWQYLLHGLLEKNGRLPRWEEFEAHFFGEAAALYFHRFKEAFRFDRMPRAQQLRYEKALHWRMGCSYYSFLREVDLMTRLRVQHGLPIRYHLLADVQFKIDMWCGQSLVAVYIGNESFRQGEFGRKERMEKHMDVSRFTVLDLELEAPTTYGSPSLVSEDSVRRAAEAIKRANGA